ncbi:MAG: transposase [Anaerolineae bacterium]|nr:transposase [Anaerolineae bacterium]
MTIKRKRHSAEFKFEVALEAAKELQTASQIASEREVHPNQIGQWKKQLLDKGASIFSNKNFLNEKKQNERETALYEQIGRLKPVLSLPK